MNAIKTFDTYFDRACMYTLVLSVGMMLFFSVLSIVLRWFGLSLAWIEPLVRHLVFLGAFLGGVLATGRGTHIGIDVASKILESKGMHRILANLGRIIAVASFSVLIWLAYSSFEFVKQEQEFGKESFWGLTSGQLVTIIPIGFGLIALRYALKFILSFGQKEGV